MTIKIIMGKAKLYIKWEITYNIINHKMNTQ